MTYIIRGAPRTKKTSNRLVMAGKYPRVLPSAAFKSYERVAVPQLWAQHRGLGMPTFHGPVSVKATFYRDKNLGDWTGFVQALADILEAAQVVVNDRQIKHWDGTRLDKDAENPRVELEVREVAA